MNKTILITGATSGIGKATAIHFAALGARLILCGRRQERLNQLKEELPTEVHILNFDVRDRTAVFEAIESLPETFEQIDVLINNAGNAHGLDDVIEANLDDWDAMIDGNVKGVMYVTKAVLPLMTKRKSGHIINVGSIAGLEVYPKGNVYCSSKFAINAFTQGLRIDLNPIGIRVGAVHPGLVETEFSEVRFKGDVNRAKSVYNQLDALQAEDIANTIAFMVHAPEHVTIADITILPTAQANASVLNKK
ncbi:MAG: NAD(P)-dependent oxidoreductase [Flavobacteriales bacterium]|jgi:NADP-dependent 3-hydroxy acid dehydrogenase YdfG|nr:NAD(P)-dependent oxidoreductase [Candidatus Arcticimaribacter sp.]|tara:strand:+ start:4402 stop:5148 length:747 start_codon:yes stop_codon:yes gene_type:complete